MAKVLGVGGVFFKSPDPDRLYQWYAEHLGISRNDEPGVSFQNSEQSPAGYIVWGAFDGNTKYFEPADKQYMFNLVVDDLEGALQQVEKGRFGEREGDQAGDQEDAARATAPARRGCR